MESLPKQFCAPAGAGYLTSFARKLFG